MTTLALSSLQQQKLSSAEPLLWLNPHYQKTEAATCSPDLSLLYQAQARLERFAPLLKQLFPELEGNDGLIESALLNTEKLNAEINPLGGQLWVKADHALPVAGSIKARGGIHEVLCIAETLALDNGLLANTQDDYRQLSLNKAKQLFNQYEISVGSTGNLGLSVGIIGAALGFSACVHMSSDAKEWKKTRLRDRGVKVVEHSADYGAAVAAGRVESENNPNSYFVDDENSSALFMGYAVAALRLQQQLIQQSIPVDQQHPLFVYLPAGVGGAPGGITFGLKAIFGEHVHCFFAEPTQAPCMLLGYAGQPGQPVTDVYQYSLTVDTQADGLAVGCASQWVCDSTRDLVSGVYTQQDDSLYRSLRQLKELEDIKVEPSAAIGCLGPAMLDSPAGHSYMKKHNLQDSMQYSNHIIWTTGGLFVPDNEYQKFILR